MPDETNEDGNKDTPPQGGEDFLVVGVGASAGGLGQLKKFVGALPPRPDFSIVIIQHLDPDHETIVADLLSRESRIPVSLIQAGERVRYNHIYVIPSGQTLELNGGHFRLSKLKKQRGGRDTIDHFFRSLAEQKGRKGVGIIFSGAGSDGTAGLRAIKAAGGLTIVQTPETAEYSSMPLSAIRNEIVDRILPVQEIGAVLKEYAKHPYLDGECDTIEGNDTDVDGQSNPLHDLTALLDHHEGFDLRQYKPGTILRRVSRRMSFHQMKNMRDYLEHVREDDEERKQLTKDLLIKVTDFFRNPPAFDVLEQEAINHIVEKASGKIRIWVPGCATGEEAYSLAILVFEALQRAKKDNLVRIFATDVDEEAIQIARRGSYPASIAREIPPHYLERYFFAKDNDQFQVKKEIRESISFAKQNVVSDPPFSKIHLISCRNLLIYLKREVQERVFKSFCFSLVPHGFLFLGTSESLGTAEKMFSAVSKKWRIYKKKPGFERRTDLYPNMGRRRSEASEVGSRSRARKNPSGQEVLRNALFNACMPPTILVGDDDRSIYYHGDLKAYVHIPEGEPTFELHKMVRHEIRHPLRTALFKTRQSGESQTFSCAVKKFDTDDGESLVEVSTHRAFADGILEDNGIAVTFVDRGPYQERTLKEKTEKLPEDRYPQALALELAETKEALQNTIEELETSSEELKAANEEALSTNEELQSTNEELQSANEELESSSEELRSLNEELCNTNEQLSDKIEEVRRAKDDVHNFFSSTDIATVFFDDEFNLQRFTPSAEFLLRLGKSDCGRPIGSFASDLFDEDLHRLAKQVHLNFQPSYSEKQAHDGRWFVRHITPYRTSDRKVEGVVITLQEITELKRLTSRAETRERQQSSVAKLGLLALADGDIENLMELTVRQLTQVLDVEYCKILKFQPEQDNFLLLKGIGWHDGLVGEATVPADLGSQAGFTLTQKDPVIVNDLEDENRFEPPQLLKDHHVASGMSCTINHTSVPFGVLGVHSTRPRSFTVDDANFVLSVANLLSAALRTRETMQQLRASEARLQAAKDTSRMGIHEWHVKTNTVVWDDLLRELWGFDSDEELSLQKFLSGLHPDDIEKSQAALAKALDPQGDGRYFTQYRVVNRKTKQINWVDASGSVFFENNQPSLLVGMVVDVTEHKSTAKKLEEAVAELKLIDENKNSFLSVLGHELRNPLGVLDGCLEELESEAGSSECIGMMRRNLNTMVRLLDDLLDLSRISRKQIHIQKEPVELAQILERARDNVSKVYDGCDVKIASNVPARLMILGDEVRLGQVFQNLLDNACKYSPSGGNVEMTAQESSRQVVVTIRDSGRGIEKEKLTKIFEPFYQDRVPTRMHTGLGIGLALVRQLVELHDGQVTVQSEGKDKGAAFTVIFPKPPEALLAEGGANAPSESAAPALKGWSVLMVEDNVDLLKATRRKLERWGCEVDIAKTGTQGLKRALEAGPYDLILLDLDLPDRTGYEVAREIREKQGEKPLIVALSGFGHEDAKAKARESGFDFHLSKPLSLEDLAKRAKKR